MFFVTVFEQINDDYVYGIGLKKGPDEETWDLGQGQGQGQRTDLCADSHLNVTSTAAMTTTSTFCRIVSISDADVPGLQLCRCNRYVGACSVIVRHNTHNTTSCCRPIATELRDIRTVRLCCERHRHYRLSIHLWWRVVRRDCWLTCLPEDISLCSRESDFKRQLKTCLFNTCRNLDEIFSM